MNKNDETHNFLHLSFCHVGRDLTGSTFGYEDFDYGTAANQRAGFPRLRLPKLQVSSLLL
ncbi:MAG: hypothetical protein ACPGJR_09520 [Akkermansiaceae bacterium]